MIQTERKENISSISSGSKKVNIENHQKKGENVLEHFVHNIYANEQKLERNVNKRKVFYLEIVLKHTKQIKI